MREIFGSVRRREERRRSVKMRELLVTLRQFPGSIIWLSPPHLKNPKHEKYLINTRGVIKVSTALINVKYIDVNQLGLLGTKWQPVMDGQKIRTDDGIHVSRNGSYRVIRELTNNINKYH